MTFLIWVVDLCGSAQEIYPKNQFNDFILILISVVVSNYTVLLTTFTFTFRALARCFYPKRLIKSIFVERDRNISLWYIKIRIEQV